LYPLLAVHPRLLGLLLGSARLPSARVSAFLDFLKAAFPLGTSEQLAAYITA
jgi:hypothetical protein